MEHLLIEESDNFNECNSCFGQLCQDPLGCLDSLLVDEEPYCTLNEEVELNTQMRTFIAHLMNKLF